jgi:hypothetical protein
LKDVQESTRVLALEITNLKEDVINNVDDLKQNNGTGLFQDVRETKIEFVQHVEDGIAASMVEVQTRLDKQAASIAAMHT